MGSATGLLTRGSLLRRLPGSRPVASWRGSVSPSQRRDRPGLAPGSLTALLVGGRAYHRTSAGSRVHRPVRLWLPVVLWAALIFAFSSVPDLGTGLGGWDLVLRKVAHAAEYAVLGALLARALRSPGIAVLVGVLYAVSDEVHQAFVPGQARVAARRRDRRGRRRRRGRPLGARDRGAEARVSRRGPSRSTSTAPSATRVRSGATGSPRRALLGVDPEALPADRGRGRGGARSAWARATGAPCSSASARSARPSTSAATRRRRRRSARSPRTAARSACSPTRRSRSRGWPSRSSGPTGASSRSRPGTGLSSGCSRGSAPDAVVVRRAPSSTGTAA